MCRPNRLWCSDAFARAGLPATLAQTSASFNHAAGTLRGLHFTWPPSGEGKLVRCARGRMHDLLLDLRPDSPTFLRHCSVVLDADERHAVWIPPGVEHVVTVLEDAEIRTLYVHPGARFFGNAADTPFSRWSTARKCTIR